MPPAPMPAWARQWQKFFVERAGIDSLHFGLLLLMLLSLLMLFLTIMSVFIRFCCCTHCPPRHRKRSTTETLTNRTPSNGGFFSGTNEERRCLLQPNGICAGQTQQKQQQNAKTEEQLKMEQRDGQAVTGTNVVDDDPEQSAAQSFRQQPKATENVTIVDETVTPPTKCQSSLTPLMAHRGQLLPPHRTTAHLPAESPPPPRRFATGGRTQVLPLTAQNCRRVTPLVMLMADQQQQQRQQQIARGRMPTTSDSRATTTTGTNSAMKSCATIHEDPEEANRLLSDELLSIDRTFVSVGDEQLQQNMYYAAHRLPINQQPPTFEVQPPSYSPPEPPNNKPLTINICRESINFSRCSYGGAQTPLNTTTGSSSADPSVDSILNGCGRRGAQVRISELESEINADGTPNCANVATGQLEPSCHAVMCRRVPRSISQQLELMNMAQQQQPSPDQQQ